MSGLQVFFYAVDLISMKGNGGHASCALPPDANSYPVPCKVPPMQIQYPNRLRPEPRSPFKAQQFEFAINRCDFATSIWNECSLIFKKIHFKLWFMNLNEEDKQYVR